MNHPFSALRVLLVDDDPWQLSLLGQQLKRLQVENIQTCLRNDHALALVSSAPESIDLIFCDLQMPDMDGVEFLRHLGQTNYAGALSLVSGEDDSILRAADRLARSRQFRLCGAFNKPIQSGQLHQALSTALAARPAARGQGSRAPGEEFSASDLSRAILKGELFNHYQPKVDFATGRWVGVETLVRWMHPELGIVYPDRFIPLAEEHGLIDQLTEHVLFGPKGAVEQARSWQDGGRSLHVAVNVSMENLKDPTFPDTLARRALRAGVDPSRLTIEVTESRMVSDAEAALDILTRLRLKRVGVSIDDFGTGHSSLRQLHDMPFDELKLDRSFVHGAHSDPTLKAILLPCLDMARQLGIRVVAEGVEDADDWRYLRELGCAQAQGYFVARPMVAPSLADWLARWACRPADEAAGPDQAFGERASCTTISPPKV